MAGYLIDLAAEVVFGHGGNSAAHERGGFSVPETGFTWTIGPHSAFTVRLAPPPPESGPRHVLELDVSPFLVAGIVTGQRLKVAVNGVIIANERIERDGILAFDIPAIALRDGVLLIDLHHEESRCPVDFGISADPRQLAFMIASASVLRLPEAEPADRILLPPARPPEGAAAIELMLNFESLGHNCEFGIMQRHCGAEPLGLLRFSAITLRSLLRGLDLAFAGIGEPESLAVFLNDMPRREFLVRDTRYDIVLHTFRYDGETTDAEIRAGQSQQLRFFHRKFLEVLQTGERIFVFQQPGQNLAAHMAPLLTLLQSHGPNALLYVTAGDDQPSGSVEQVGPGLFHGFIDRLAPVEDVGLGNCPAWLSICANAAKLWRGQKGS